MKLYSFDFGPYPQRLNIYPAEKSPVGLEQIIFDKPDRTRGAWCASQRR